VVLLFSSLLVLFISDFSSRERALSVMYISSFTAVVLSVYSYVKYLRHER
jgi:hypothetical protein